MAPRRFPQFTQLPPELRLRVWRWLMLPQIIRAQWDQLSFNEVYFHVYWLYVGAMPITLQICGESRAEAMKHYSLMRSRLPLRPESREQRDGERAPPSSLAKTALKTTPKKEHKYQMQRLWVNFNMDTCYFVNFPAGYEFCAWYNRMHKPNLSGLSLNNPLRHFALEGESAQRLRNSGRTDIFYLMCMQHPELETITIVLDNSRFTYDQPADYQFRTLKDTDDANDKRTGGKYANAEVREQIAKIFVGFWEGRPNIKNCDKWRAWRAKNPSWKEPEVMMRSISKTPRETKKAIKAREAADHRALEHYKAKQVLTSSMLK